MAQPLWKVPPTSQFLPRLPKSKMGHPMPKSQGQVSSVATAAGSGAAEAVGLYFRAPRKIN